MRWPWSRSEPAATPEPGPERIAAPPPERPTAAWAALPAMQRTMPPPVLTTSPATFAAGLTAWRTGALMTSIQRQVHPVIPRIGPDPEAWGVGGPTQTAAATSMPLRQGPAGRRQPQLQRHVLAGPNASSSAAPTAASRPGDRPVASALTSAPTLGLPVVQLTAEPVTPELELHEEAVPQDGGVTAETMQPDLAHSDSAAPHRADSQPAPQETAHIDSMTPGLPVQRSVDRDRGPLGAAEPVAVAQAPTATVAPAASPRPTVLAASSAPAPPAATPAPPPPGGRSSTPPPPVVRSSTPAPPVVRSSTPLPVQRSAEVPTASPAAEESTAGSGVPDGPPGPIERRSGTDGVTPSTEPTGIEPPEDPIRAPGPSRPRLGLGEPLPSTPSSEAPRTPSPAPDLVGPDTAVRPDPPFPGPVQRIPVVQRTPGDAPTSAPPLPSPVSTHPGHAAPVARPGDHALPLAAGPRAGDGGSTTVEIPWVGASPAAEAPVQADASAPTPAAVAVADPGSPIEPTAPSISSSGAGPVELNGPESSAAPQDSHQAPAPQVKALEVEALEVEAADPPREPPALSLSVAQGHDPDPSPIVSSPVAEPPGNAGPSGAVDDATPAPTTDDVPLAQRAADPEVPRNASLPTPPSGGPRGSSTSAAGPSLGDLRVVPLQRLLDLPSPTAPAGPRPIATAPPDGIRPVPRAGVTRTTWGPPTPSPVVQRADAVSRAAVTVERPPADPPGAVPGPSAPLQALRIGEHRAVPTWTPATRLHEPAPAAPVGMPLGRPGPAAFGPTTATETGEAATAEPGSSPTADAAAPVGPDAGSSPPATSVVQAADAAPSGAAPSAAHPVAGAAAADPAQSAGQVDELARKLFDPLMLRLRAELLIERERRGLRTDAW